MDNEYFGPPHRPPHGEQPARPRIELECIGSFVALTQDKEPHTIEIWTKFGAAHDRNRSRLAPGLIVLTTTEGRDVEFVAPGQYRLHDNPEISLSSNDPGAP